MVNISVHDVIEAAADLLRRIPDAVVEEDYRKGIAALAAGLCIPEVLDLEEATTVMGYAIEGVNKCKNCS